MRYWRKVVAACVGCTALLLGACAGEVYRPSTWMHAAPDTDFDVDSALCLERSELTADDAKRVAQIRANASTYGEVFGDAAYHSSYVGDHDAAELLSFIGSLIASHQSTTAEEKVRSLKFAECMVARGWKKG